MGGSGFLGLGPAPSGPEYGSTNELLAGMSADSFQRQRSLASSIQQDKDIDEVTRRELLNQLAGSDVKPGALLDSITQKVNAAKQGDSALYNQRKVYQSFVQKASAQPGAKQTILTSGYGFGGPTILTGGG